MDFTKTEMPTVSNISAIPMEIPNGIFRLRSNFSSALVIEKGGVHGCKTSQLSSKSPIEN